MTTLRSCPYCQTIVVPHHGMYPQHFASKKVRCPVSWNPVSWRTTLRATRRGILDIITK